MPYKRAKADSKYEPKSTKLMDQVHEVLRYHHYAIRTEKAYVNWILKFIKFNGTRHPKEMGKKEIEQFLSHLAVNRKVAVSTQNQAFNAILFLYKDVLLMPIGDKIESVRSKKTKKITNCIRQKRSQPLD